MANYPDKVFLLPPGFRGPRLVNEDYTAILYTPIKHKQLYSRLALITRKKSHCLPISSEQIAFKNIGYSTNY